VLLLSSFGASASGLESIAAIIFNYFVFRCLRLVVDTPFPTNTYTHTHTIYAHPARYAEFSVVGVPYPGVELFRLLHRADYNIKKMVYFLIISNFMLIEQEFDWGAPSIDTTLQLPESHGQALNIDWGRYKEWDVVELTSNYMRLFLQYLRSDEPSSGM
jgi:hypothetical protein